jgi:hypothetical protein
MQISKAVMPLQHFRNTSVGNCAKSEKLMIINKPNDGVWGEQGCAGLERMNVRSLRLPIG